MPKTAAKKGVSEISMSALLTITEMLPPMMPPAAVHKHVERITQVRVERTIERFTKGCELKLRVIVCDFVLVGAIHVWPSNLLT